MFYLCLVLGLGPGVGRGVLTWLMSSMLARGAREVLALLAIITVWNVDFTSQQSPASPFLLAG